MDNKFSVEDNLYSQSEPSNRDFKLFLKQICSRLDEFDCVCKVFYNETLLLLFLVYLD